MSLPKPASPVLGLALAFLSAAACAPEPEPATGAAIPATVAPIQAAPEALDRAFDFASAIESDPGDRAAAQQAVVLDLLELGAVDAATARARAVDGWRRGICLAECALALARTGRDVEARALIPAVELAAEGAEGWRGPRVRAHLALALAVLGDADRSRELAETVAVNDPRQYAGRSAAVLAAALASRGEQDEAFELLSSLKGAQDLDAVRWRTEGWLELARSEALSREGRVEALREARRSADGVPGWRRVTLLLDLSRLATELDDASLAHSSLEAGEALLGEADEPAPSQATLLASLAAAWAGLGERERGRALAARAEGVIDGALSIERPGLTASVAGAWAALGDGERAQAGFAQALDLAAGLVNARPRALAVVATCRSLGRHGVTLDAGLSGRLDDLRAGLGAPW